MLSVSRHRRERIESSTSAPISIARCRWLVGTQTELSLLTGRQPRSDATCRGKTGPRQRPDQVLIRGLVRSEPRHDAVVDLVRRQRSEEDKLGHVLRVCGKPAESLYGPLSAETRFLSLPLRDVLTRQRTYLRCETRRSCSIDRCCEPSEGTRHGRFSVCPFEIIGQRSRGQ
jgi:hypothetical protein